MGGRGSGRPQFRTAGDATELQAGEYQDDLSTSAGDGDLSQALDQFPHDAAKIRVYKWGRVQGAAGLEEGWLRCATFPAAEFDADALVARWGAGNYRFQCIGPDGRTVRHLKQAYAAPAPAPSTGPIQQPVPSPVTGAGAASSDRFEAFLLAMLQNQQQLLLTVLGRPAGSSDVKVSDVISAFREGRSMAPAAPASETLLEALRIGVEVAGPGNAAPGGEGSMLETIAGRVLGLLDKAMTAPAPAQPPQPVAAGPPRPPAPAPTVAADPLLTLARQYAPRLLAEAEKGRDGLTWGAFVAERVPEAWLPVLARLARATAADRMRVLAGVDPRLAAHAEWIEDAAEGIRDVLGGDNTSAPPRGGGDLDHGDADPADHQGAGTPADGAGRGGAD